MTTTLIAPAPLTKEDIAAIRKADSFVYFYNQQGEISEFGIRLFHRVTVPEGWVDTHISTSRTIPTEGKLSSYDQEHNKRGYDIRTAVCHDSAGPYSDPSASATMAAFLKVGDSLKVRFVADNSSENIRKVNYKKDECWLEVTRGKKTYKFLIEVQVGPNNSARMVQF